MLTTRQVFNYTLRTGRDIFDDFEQLDCHHARMELGIENEYGLKLSLVLEGLDAIGLDVDTLDLNSVLRPTVAPEDDDDRDFVVDPELEKRTRARTRFPKKGVSKVLQSFIISEHISDDVLLDAPFDTATAAYNDAIKERNRQMKRRT